MGLRQLQADADLNQALVTGTIRRQPNLNFQSAYAAGLEGKKDPEVLAIAAQDGRVLAIAFTNGKTRVEVYGLIWI